MAAPSSTSPSVGIRITGLKESQATLEQSLDGCATWQRTRIGIGSDVPYAYWVEHGHYFGGRPGSTRAVRYMSRALADILPKVGARIAVAIPLGGPAVSAEADKISKELAGRAQSYVTVRSGRLRGSIRPNRGQGLRGML